MRKQEKVQFNESARDLDARKSQSPIPKCIAIKAQRTIRQLSVTKQSNDSNLQEKQEIPNFNDYLLMRSQYRSSSTKAKLNQFQTLMSTLSNQANKQLSVFSPTKSKIISSQLISNSPTLFELPNLRQRYTKSPSMLQHVQTMRISVDNAETSSPLTYSMKNVVNNIKLLSPTLCSEAPFEDQRKLSLIDGRMKEIRPCARDGHIAIYVENQNKMLVFGGDRYRHSLSGVFMLDLNKIPMQK